MKSVRKNRTDASVRLNLSISSEEKQILNRYRIKASQNGVKPVPSYSIAIGAAIRALAELHHL